MCIDRAVDNLYGFRPVMFSELLNPPFLTDFNFEVYAKGVLGCHIPRNFYSSIIMKERDSGVSNAVLGSNCSRSSHNQGSI